MHDALQKTFYWLQMVADVTSAVQDCVDCAKNLVHVRKQAKLLESFPMFDPLESVAIKILGPPLKSRCGFQYIIMIANQFAK